jgi:UDP-glucose 4-epimerase
MINKNILITGGTGYVGSHLIITLLKNNYKVIVVDNLSNSKINVINKIKKLSSKSIKFYKADIKNRNSLLKIFKKNKIKCVIHLAALKSVNESVKNAHDYYNTNVLGTINLVNVMKKFNVKKMIFSSSAVVYGKTEKLPCSEKHKTNPTNPYASTKIACEEYFTNLAKEKSDWKIISLRYFNPVGNHPSGLIADNPKNANNIMPILNELAVGKRKFLEIYGNNYPTKDGTAIRDYVHVMDVGNAHFIALKKISKIQGHTILNIGTGKGTSVLELFNTYKSENRLKINKIFSKRRMGDVAKSFANVKKAKIILKWKAKYKLKDMCTSSYTFAKKYLTK